MSSQQNFWQLIKDNRIEIPVIQRDYAQGREEDKINTLRFDFVSDLVNSLKEDNSKKVHLGFIYGKLNGKDKLAEKDRNKKAIANILNAVEGYAKHLELKISSQIESIGDDKKDFVNLPVFIPLDGQQRLTTLFLLHWYLIQYLNKDEFETHTEILKRFSYKIRKSSANFCEALCHIENKISISKKLISETIKNSKWFLNVWLNDSTVKGMLVMLDEIHNQIKDLENKVVLLNNLKKVDQRAVSFDFFDLDELNQTDELYVKMNARGQQLTEFEHFKAWLQKHIYDNEIKILDTDWKTKLDKTWLDLFWKKKESFYIDNIIYNAFKQIILLEYIAKSDKAIERFVQSVKGKEYVSFQKFNQLEYFSENTLNFLFKGLNQLTNDNNIHLYEEWLKDIACAPFINKEEHLSNYFLKDEKDINLPETVFYYAFLLFIIDDSNDNNLNKQSFQSWMRVCRNLIFNTYIQNPKNFINAIKSIDNLSSYKEDIFEFLLKPDLKIDFFSSNQIKEEVRKAKLVSEHGEELLNKILEFENHEYFNAEIGFLLEFANKDGIFNKDKFIFYGERASVLFSNEIRNHSEKLLQRALLCIGDYLPQVGSNYTFCLSNADSLRARRDNWQRVLNNPDYSIMLKKLIDDNLKDKSNIELSLESCISNYTQDDWMQFIINCPETIGFCKQGFIRYENDDNIKLLETSRAYGKHAELRSFNFYKNKLDGSFKKEPFGKLYYWKNRMSKYEFPCIRFSDWEVENEKFRLEITFKESIYFVQFFKEDKNTINNKSINEYFINEEWSKEDSVFFKEFKTQEELKNNLDIVLADLNNLKV